MTPTVADVLVMIAKALAGFGLLRILWIWADDPVNRDSRFAGALLAGILVVIAYFVRFLP